MTDPTQPTPTDTATESGWRAWLGKFWSRNQEIAEEDIANDNAQMSRMEEALQQAQYAMAAQVNQDRENAAHVFQLELLAIQTEHINGIRSLIDVPAAQFDKLTGEMLPPSVAKIREAMRVAAALAAEEWPQRLKSAGL
jgi:hypothetical protein